jgi:hypothetical protein
MRFQGHNILAIILAALVIYGLEFLLYGLAIQPEQFQAMSGVSAEQGAAIGMSRMPFGIIMPVLAAIGISFAIKWRQRPGMGSGAITAVIMALCFGFGSRMYGYVYGAHTETYLAIDFARYVVTYGVAGAIIGAWR